mmetsp:Transcript_6198/g.17783  ORF Transcript_6198/g.17783 Transcript_6198/m.17783 type:complete len:118 (+) Transcript_6198:1789-2142(+)
MHMGPSSDSSQLLQLQGRQLAAISDPQPTRASERGRKIAGVAALIAAEWCSTILLLHSVILRTAGAFADVWQLFVASCRESREMAAVLAVRSVLRDCRKVFHSVTQFARCLAEAEGG